MVATLGSIGGDRQFASMIAHEIRRPLTTILLAAQHALRTKDPGEAQTALQGIVSDACIGAKIVTEILHMSDSEAPEKSCLDINALIRETVAELAKGMAASGVTIHLSLEDLLPHTCASATAIRQILMNLIDNAVAAITEEGHINISTQRAGGHVEMIVQDDGSGIAPHDLPRIFDPFFTTKADRGGTGLGLVICRCLAAAHDGTIEVSSQLGRGSRFCVRLPAAPGECCGEIK